MFEQIDFPERTSTDFRLDVGISIYIYMHFSLYIYIFQRTAAEPGRAGRIMYAKVTESSTENAVRMKRIPPEK